MIKLRPSMRGAYSIVPVSVNSEITDAMKSQVKLHVFRDFLIAKSRNWSY